MTGRLWVGVALTVLVGVLAGCGGGPNGRYASAETASCIRALPDFVTERPPQPARRALSIQIVADEPLPPEAGVGPDARHLDVTFTEAGESRSTLLVQLLFMPDEQTAKRWIERTDAGLPVGAASRNGNLIADWYGNEGSNTVRIPP